MRNATIDRSGLGLDGVNQVQMLFKTVVESPDSRYRTSSGIVQTAKENVLWHGIYNLTKQTVPLAWYASLKDSSYGKYLALICSLILIIISFPRNRFALAVYFSLLPIVMLMLLMVIGGSERYWLTISQLLMLAALLNLASAKRFGLLRSNLQRSKPAVPAVVVTSLLIVNLGLYIIQFEKQPYNPREHYPDFTRFVMSLDGYCETGDPRKLTVKTQNPQAFRLFTGCFAPMSKEKLAIRPDYNAVVIHRQQLVGFPEEEDIIWQTAGWYLLKRE